jgi:hypothetical protein
VEVVGELLTAPPPIPEDDFRGHFAAISTGQGEGHGRRERRIEVMSGRCAMVSHPKETHERK